MDRSVSSHAPPLCLTLLAIAAPNSLVGSGRLQGVTPSREVRVAAAADLKFALDEVALAFNQKWPHIKLKLTYGSSGNFYAQLTQQAPFDVFFSADVAYPRKLVEQGLASPDTLFKYAVGQIVVWVRKSSPLDLNRLGIQSLLDPSVKKIAIANPTHAPYGRAAEAALKKLGVYEAVRAKLVFGENIAQTAQFVDSGAAEVGIIALSLATAPDIKEKGRLWKVPLDAYSPLEQGGVILSSAKDKEAAEAFRSFVMGAEGRTTMKRYGFSVPGE